MILRRLSQRAFTVFCVAALALGAAWVIVRSRSAESLTADYSGPGLVEIGPVSYGLNDLAQFTGRQHPFSNINEAISIAGRFIDHVLLEDAIRELQRAPNDELSHRDAVWRLAETRHGLRREVNETEIRARYEATIDIYVHPGLVNVVYFHVLPGPPLDDMRALARALRTRGAMQSRLSVFYDQLRGNEPGWRGGEVYSVRCPDGPAAELPGPVVEVACGLERLAFSGPIETPQGIYVVRAMGHMPPGDTRLEQVHDQIRRDLERERYEQAEQAVVAGLRIAARPRVNHVAIAALVPAPPDEVLLVSRRAEVPPAAPGTNMERR